MARTRGTGRSSRRTSTASTRRSRSIGRSPRIRSPASVRTAGDPRAAEIAGLIAATLAVGNTTAIRGAFGRVAGSVGNDFPGFVEGTTAANYATQLGRFRHRWIRGDQIGYLALRLRRLYESYPTLETLFLEGSAGTPGGFAGGLHALALGLRGDATGMPEPPAGYVPLFPSPIEKPSTACKRMTLYVRWMVRDRFPDLGVWARVPMGELRVPLDHHVHWIAYHIGLTRRRSRSWAAVEEITETLRPDRPDGPDQVRFRPLPHRDLGGLPEGAGHRRLRAVLAAARLPALAGPGGRVTPALADPGLLGPVPGGGAEDRLAAGRPGDREAMSVRIAHLHDEEARVESRERAGETTFRTDSGPVGALVLLMEIDRRGAPTRLIAHDAGAVPGFPRAPWRRSGPAGAAPEAGRLPLPDLVSLARYTLA